MKTVILSGGKGINLPGKNDFITKVFINVNGMPLIYYILKHLYFYGIEEIILCVDSFSEKDINTFLHDKTNKSFLVNLISRLRIQVINYGENGKTGSMLFGMRKLLEHDNFIVTYNDIITDINISQLIQYHKAKDKILTVTGVHPTIRHGVIKHKNGLILRYDLDEPIETTIKGGYFVLKPEIFKYLSDDCVLENEPFQKLISERQAVVYEHHGFWKEFDSYKHIEEMEKLFKQDNPSWLIQ